MWQPHDLLSICISEENIIILFTATSRNRTLFGFFFIIVCANKFIARFSCSAQWMINKVVSEEKPNPKTPDRTIHNFHCRQILVCCLWHTYAHWIIYEMIIYILQRIRIDQSLSHKVTIKWLFIARTFCDAPSKTLPLQFVCACNERVVPVQLHHHCTVWMTVDNLTHSQKSVGCCACVEFFHIWIKCNGTHMITENPFTDRNQSS